LAHYTDPDWGALPEWNPRVSPIRLGVESPVPDDSSWSALAIDEVPWERDELIELGREAFFGYPVQVVRYVRSVATESDASKYGFWTSGDAIGGAVWTELPLGLVEPALTCAGCHASADSGVVVPGKNNADLDLDRLTADHYSSVAGGWGPGRVDVTPDGISNPTAIADLRAVRSQVRLHRAATVDADFVALTLRTETLLITAFDQAWRPPRKLVFAMALYMHSLEPEPVREPDARSGRGEAIFDATCSGCHVPPAFSGAPVAVDRVGTAVEVVTSPDRYTGTVRVPSLRGVGDRRRLFANGAVRDVHELLDPAREAPGHAFGLQLDAAARGDLIRYLETL
jgi:mono/diheme cytochrome c family protein